MQPTVLLVDDERSICSALKRTFRLNQFTVHEANSGQEALTILDNNDVDVVVSDQRMPGMTGTELLSIVRHQYPRIGRIILSGHSDSTDLIQAINEAKIKHFVPKPWDEKELVSIVEKALPPRLDDSTNTPFLTLQDTQRHHTKPNDENVLSLEKAITEKQIKFDRAIRNSELELDTFSYQQSGGQLTPLNQLKIRWPEHSTLTHSSLIKLADQPDYLHDLFTWYLISIIDAEEKLIDNNQNILIDLFSSQFLHSLSTGKLLDVLLKSPANFTFLMPYESLAEIQIYNFFESVQHHKKSVALNIANRIIDISNIDIPCIEYIAMDGRIAALGNEPLNEKRKKMMSDIANWNYHSLLINTEKASQREYANKMVFDYY